uniref:Ribonuclease H-like domain-containing protein n=1 Tax=Tanacetum cinerariifolium TaxID=118510 RepID=A0A6L2N0A2_TANCI|nr:ribonuclease H-like domain-containing protein [Tanacetum cinerariifolium]
MGEPLSPDRVFDFPMDEPEPHPACDFLNKKKLNYTQDLLFQEEIIENGNAPIETKTIDGKETVIPPTSVEEKAQRRAELKARRTLLMALPNEHQLKFNSYKDAKTLMQTIENRFGGVIEQTYERIQKLISQMKMHGEVIPQKEINQKFLRSLSQEWTMHTITMRTRRFLKNTRRKLDMANKERIRKENRAPIIEDWVSESEEEDESKFQTVKPDFTKIEGNPQQDLKDKRVIDIGCSRHMRRNRFYLTDYEEINGGFVAFRDLKLTNESHVLLKVTRKDNMYSVDLKNVIPQGGIENLINLRMKVIRYDNRTKFKNRVMNQFCEMKGIKREFSVARTLQQNGVAKRKNKTLIEAARTMLADLKLPTTFWAEVVNTTYYVQNRVLVIKPNNRTPYELFLGRKHALSFMKPFECLVTILNTIDHLGKFDGKTDERFFIGYSTNSKAFRVFNSRTRIVEQNLHVKFSENTHNIVGSGPNWLFYIDALTKSINYKPVVVGNQSNGSVGTKECDNVGKTRVEIVAKKDYILLPLWTQDLPFSSSTKDSPGVGYKPSREEEKKDTEDPGNEDSNTPITKEPRVNQEKDSVNNTNRVNAISSTVNAASNEVNVVGGKSSIKIPNDPNMPELEDISIFKDSNEDVFGAKADLNNLESTFQVSPIPITRIHKDHPLQQVIGYLHSAPQIRRMLKNLEACGLVSSKWVCRNKMDERGSVIKNKARLVTQGHTQEEGIGYDEVFAPVVRIEPIRMFLAYASFKDFVVYQMDVKSSFLYGKIKEEVYVCQPLGFEDSDFPNKVYKVEKVLYGLHQVPRTWPDIMFAVCACAKFQVNPKISHLYAVRKIFRYLKGASLERKSTTGGCQFLGCRLISWQCKKQTVVANFITEAEYIAVSNCCRQVLWIQNQLIGATTCQGGWKKVVIFEASIRRGLRFGDEGGIDSLPNETIFEQLSLMGVLNLETTKTAQAKEISRLKKRVKRLEKKRKSRTYELKILYKIFAESVDVAKQDLIDAITLAKCLIEIKVTAAGTRPKAKNIVMQEPSETPTTIPIYLKVQDKGKGIMVEEPLKMKKKDQINFDEQEARILQAEINEQDRLVEEKAQHIKDENLAWDNVQAIIDADYELAARLQEEEQGELTIEEKSRLFVELIDKRKKHFAKLRAEKKTSNQSLKEE